MGPVLSGITQGRATVSRAAGCAAVHQVEYAAGAFMPTHSHRRANVTLVLAGSVDDEADGSLFRAGALSVVLKPSTVEHRTRCGERGLRTLVVELDDAAEHRLRATLGVFRRCVWVTGGEMVRATVRLWAGLRGGRANPRELVDAWLGEIPEACGLFAEPAAGDEPDALAGARAALRHGGAGTAEVARAARVHPSTMTRLFKRHLGVGVMGWVRRERVSAAAGWLGGPGVSLARVALECGFADQSHMCRDFKRETGLSPAVYRGLLAP